MVFEKKRVSPVFPPQNYDTEVSAKAVAAEAEPANQASQCGAEGLSALGLMEAQGDKTPRQVNGNFFPQMYY